VVAMGAPYRACARRHTGPMRTDPGRRRRGALAVALGAALVAVLLAACSSGPPARSQRSSSTGPTTPRAAAPKSTPSTATPASTLPPVPTSGPLQPGAPIAIPFSADEVTAAESPDGAVFVAPQDPTSPAPSVAWVVDGNGPAAVAEHVPGGIAALAADSTNFYAATYTTVYAYDRATGNQDGQWTLPPLSTANTSREDLVAMAAAGGDVLVSITQGDAVSVYRIVPTSSAPPHLLVQGLGAAVGPDGSVYYETTGHDLAVLRPQGATTTGPALAATPTGLGGGVQYVDVVAGAAVWVVEPAGQGLDARFSTYDTVTLAPIASYSGVVTSTVVDTAAGPLVLEESYADPSCPQPAAGQPAAGCVLRIDQHGTTSDPVAVGAAVTLLGPGPAVVVSDTTTGQFDLVRLS